MASQGRGAALAPQRGDAICRLQHVKTSFRGAFAALAASALLLAGCAEEPESGLVVTVEGFAGLVAADEPNATVVGREVLGRNGTAMDAAVAMGMTMAVTMPSRVGLGGGGACLTWSRGDRLAEALMFPPVADAEGAVPPLVARAMALLHARYGTQRWEQLVSPAESLARFGFLPSRAFLRDLEAAHGRLAADPAAAALFQVEGGRWAEEGDRLRNVELASVLGGLRAQGGGYLHTPALAGRYAEAAGAAGMPIDPRAVRDATPEYKIPVEVPVGATVLHLPPPRSSAGIAAAQMWRMLTAEGWSDAPAARQARLTADAGLKALAAQQVWAGADGLPIAEPEVLVSEDSVREMAAAPAPPPLGTGQSPFAAGFVVGDRRGNAVACSFTLNGLFGRGRLARGMGMLLPEVPPAAASNTVPLAVGLVGDPTTGRLDQAVQAGGGESAFQHLVQVLLRLRGGAQAGTALAAPRVVWQGGRLVADQGMTGGELPGPVASGPDVGHVNALTCPLGLRDDGEAPCTVATDPRGAGLSERAQ
jgi:gamma-glutamyltranspeptidase/glutathione hydrolase